MRARTHISRTVADDSIQTNVIVDPSFRSHIADYGIVAALPDPVFTSHSNKNIPSTTPVRHVATELLNPPGLCLKNGNPAKRTIWDRTTSGASFPGAGLCHGRGTVGTPPFGSNRG